MELLKRTDSICPDPSETLLTLVKENKVDEIRNLIKEHGKKLLEKRYDYPYNKHILAIACFNFAKYVNAETIDVLIELGADPNCEEEAWNGKKLIHFATLGNNIDLLKHIITICDVNTLCNHTNALHVLIREGEADTTIAELLINNGINFNKFDKTNKRALYWAAKKKYAEMVRLLLRHDNRCNEKEAELIDKLNLDVKYEIVDDSAHRKTTQEDLLAYLNDEKEDQFIKLASISSNLDESYLETATRKNLKLVVRFLLDNGYCTNLNKALYIAASQGNHKLFKMLLEKSTGKLDSNILNEVLKKIDYDHSDYVDYQACFNLLKLHAMDVNNCDDSGNYPLYYAAKYGGPKTAAKLLQANASLANRNKFGYLTISDVDYNTLKEHFDDCIDIQPSNKLDKENMTITFDYTTLLPTKNNGFNDEESLNNRGVQVESDVINFISKSSDLKSLLKHPLLTSFLYMKWHKMRWIFYTNLIFYLTFCLSLLLYTITYYNVDENSRHSISYLFVVFLFATSFIFILRELFQLFIAPRKYFVNFENYIEIVLIAIVCVMLFNQNVDEKQRQQLCAVAFLLTAFEFLFLLGNYPELSTNIVMLRTVSLNFFKFLAFYAILILAFAFCFHTLFSKNPDDKFFANPFLALFKTIIMLTGEFEAGELEFNEYPITSHLVFIAFVITIAVILLNLLNGLAVSDTQEIKTEAELVGHIARAQFISDAEALIIGNFKRTRFLQQYLSCLFPNEKRFCWRNDWLGRKVCISPSLLQDGRLTVLLNQKGRVLMDNGGYCCSQVHLDRKTLKQAQVLVYENKERRKMVDQTNEILMNQGKLLVRIEELLNVVKSQQINLM